jgi:hypothetical protein
MTCAKQDIEFVQKLKDDGVSREHIADVVYGMALAEMDSIKKRRTARLNAIAKVYKK